MNRIAFSHIILIVNGVQNIFEAVQQEPVDEDKYFLSQQVFRLGFIQVARDARLLDLLDQAALGRVLRVEHEAFEHQKVFSQITRATTYR